MKCQTRQTRLSKSFWKLAFMSKLNLYIKKRPIFKKFFDSCLSCRILIYLQHYFNCQSCPPLRLALVTLHNFISPEAFRDVLVCAWMYNSKTISILTSECLGVRTYNRRTLLTYGYLINPMKMRSLWPSKTHPQNAFSSLKLDTLWKTV